MKKTFKIQVDCADCASNIEEAASRIEGVDSVIINFMTQKLKVEADGTCFDSIVDEIQRVGARIEPDFSIVR